MLEFLDVNSYFRAMIPDSDGLPKTGRGARMLGVRIPGDIEADENGFVKPGTGGMSVAPNSVWNIPNHRRPRGMRMGSAGKITDRIYALADAAVPAEKLAVRRDPKRPEMHAFVEPAVVSMLARYEKDLADTKINWRQVWP